MRRDIIRLIGGVASVSLLAVLFLRDPRDPVATDPESPPVPHAGSADNQVISDAVLESRKPKRSRLPQERSREDLREDLVRLFRLPPSRGGQSVTHQADVLDLIQALTSAGSPRERFQHLIAIKVAGLDRDAAGMALLEWARKPMARQFFTEQLVSIFEESSAPAARVHLKEVVECALAEFLKNGERWELTSLRVIFERVKHLSDTELNSLRILERPAVDMSDTAMRANRRKILDANAREASLKWLAVHRLVRTSNGVRSAKLARFIEQHGAKSTIAMNLVLKKLAGQGRDKVFEREISSWLLNRLHAEPTDQHPRTVLVEAVGSCPAIDISLLGAGSPRDGFRIEDSVAALGLSARYAKDPSNLLGEALYRYLRDVYPEKSSRRDHDRFKKIVAYLISRAEQFGEKRLKSLLEVLPTFEVYTLLEACPDSLLNEQPELFKTVASRLGAKGLEMGYPKLAMESLLTRGFHSAKDKAAFLASFPVKNASLSEFGENLSMVSTVREAGDLLELCRIASAPSKDYSVPYGRALKQRISELSRSSLEEGGLDACIAVLVDAQVDLAVKVTVLNVIAEIPPAVGLERIAGPCAALALQTKRTSPLPRFRLWRAVAWIGLTGPEGGAVAKAAGEGAQQLKMTAWEDRLQEGFVLLTLYVGISEK